jgi:hypothetical protein
VVVDDPVAAGAAVDAVDPTADGHDGVVAPPPTMTSGSKLPAATFCSLLYALGEDPGFVMDEMGHAHPGLALRVYRQAMRGGEEEKAALRVAGGGTRRPKSGGAGPIRQGSVRARAQLTVSDRRAQISHGFAAARGIAMDYVRVRLAPSSQMSHHGCPHRVASVLAVEGRGEAVNPRAMLHSSRDPLGGTVRAQHVCARDWVNMLAGQLDGPGRDSWHGGGDHE